MEKAIIGELKDGQSPPRSEDNHFMVCPVCLKIFDIRILEQIMEHVHEGEEYPPIAVQ